jgi:hypothetical protein
MYKTLIRRFTGQQNEGEGEGLAWVISDSPFHHQYNLGSRDELFWNAAANAGVAQVFHVGVAEIGEFLGGFRSFFTVFSYPR